jgi:hypothetical protein
MARKVEVSQKFTKEDMLRKVRALLARANGTDSEAERQSCLNKADQIMEAYAIETWMVESGDEEKAKLIVRKDMDVSWFYQFRGIPSEVRNELYWLWTACIRHCRCFTVLGTWDTRGETMAVYGLESDLSFLDLLFTDLFQQVSKKIKPDFDPKLSLGMNCVIAKEAGMSWEQIAYWAGMPELVTRKTVYTERYGGGGYVERVNVSSKLVTAYKAELKRMGREGERITVHPSTWAVNFMDGFCTTIKRRLREMETNTAESRSTGSGMELAIRDIRKQAEESLYQDFPDLRPHPVDCPCKTCVAARKPTRRRSVSRGRQIDWAAQTKGSQAGEQATIRTNSPGVGRTKELGS